ncbi:SLAM family member 9 [Sardina pilchardus]|uniref:SLAM family member 9 n=1 Tax=Sardina pilchardus TaxID=27697 RepID=UPI002E0F8463
MCAMCSTALLLWFASAAVTVSFSSDVVPIEIYGRKGHSIQLDFPAQPERLKASWTWDDGSQRNVIVRNNIANPDYKSKVEFFRGNLSIQLNNLTGNDSGLYFAYKQLTEWTEKAVATYKLIILDAVSKPVIRISPIHSRNNASGQNCSFSVICSSSNSWASYSCDENKCTHLQSSPSANVSINITSGNGHVKCHASNPVSTDMRSEKLHDACGETHTLDSVQDSHLQPHMALIISVVCAALLLLLCGILIWKKCRNLKAEETPNKRTEIPTVIVTGSDADEPGSQGLSIYSVINKGAKCPVVDRSAQKASSSQNQAYRTQNTEEEHRSHRQQRNKGKQHHQEDNDMTIYTTATKPLEKQRPTEDTDRTVYATATQPLERQCPQEDTSLTVYDTARPRTQTEANQADTVYYTLGHMGSGQQ